MKSFRDPNMLKDMKMLFLAWEQRWIQLLQIMLIRKKDGYRFVVDNTGEVEPFDWYNARISLDFKVNLLANGDNIAVADHNGIVNG